MPTVYLHLVRHAQGYHNLRPENHQLPDPDLTPLGEHQCAELQRLFAHHDKITHLVASPMRRTLYTCLLSFAPAVAAGKIVYALPEVQEVSNLPCDVGSAPEKLAAEFGEKVDLAMVEEGWNDKTPGSRWAPEMKKLEERAREARVWLRELGRATVLGEERDAHIVVVSHGGFLHFLTHDFDGMNAQYGTGWQNTECRTYEFEDLEAADDEEARIKETASSWRGRRGSATGLTETEQMELKVALESRLKEEFGGA
ncbi:histidine phosphatase superfamily [Echria macrotheca]|uniref:Histidine phosphatase superfamily n=1 Tax=Echria macrotheca TaxID=438768 RepID=A0AAJ0FFY6_9PEZI|nr:histidine phosphatase superfamily [Echria macrotheca]